MSSALLLESRSASGGHFLRARTSRLGAARGGSTPVPRQAAKPGPPSHKRPIWRTGIGLISRIPIMACLDQAIVSAASFLTLVMVARWTNTTEVGVFAIGTTIVGLILALQNAMVSLPYTIQRHRAEDEAREHAFCSLLQSTAVSVAAAVLLCAGAILLRQSGNSEAFPPVFLSIAAILPFVLAKEFARDFSMARLEVSTALAVDGATTAAQLGSVAWLGLSGRLSPETAYLASGISCGVSAAVWLYLSRRHFAVRTGRLWALTREGLALGRWFFVSRLAVMTQGYSTYWLSLLVGGAASAGVYAASMSVVAFANPIIFGIYNVLLPRSVLALKTRGNSGLRAQAVTDALLLGGIMVFFCGTVFLFGDRIMRLFYHSGSYHAQGSTLTLLAAATLLSAVGLPAANGLASLGRGRDMACASGAAMVLNVILVWVLMTQWGLFGAALGVLAANAAAAAGRWAAFLSALRSATEAPVEPAGSVTLAQAGQR